MINMLRNVCCCCNEVIDGEPILEKEYPDVTLLFGEEVVVLYDDACDTCKEGIRKAVADFLTSKSPQARAEVKKEEPAQAEKVEEKPPVVEEKPKAAPVRVDKDALPEQVTKQFPVNLPKHTTPNK